MSTANNTKYWYFRFRDNFFNDPSVIKMQMIPGGFEFLLILLKLYALSTNTHGILKIPIGPDGNIDITVLSAMLGNLHSITIVGCAMEYFINHGFIELVQENDEILIICAEVQNMIGTSTKKADRKRECRKNHENLIASENPEIVQGEIAEREAYGEFKNVYLTMEEHLKFFNRYENAQAILQRVSVWKARKNVDNKNNDYATLLKFEDKDGKLKQSEIEKRRICYERYKREAAAGFLPPDSVKEILTEMQFEELVRIAEEQMAKEFGERRKQDESGN